MNSTMNNPSINRAAIPVIGIAVRTTNENNQAAADIPALWQRFFSEGLAARIPNKVDDTLYCIYTDYEKDFTRPYTTVLGCAVTSLEAIPEGMTSVTIASGAYVHFEAKGNLSEGAVYEAWTKIWNSGLERAYSTDVEVYGARAQNPEEAVVDIWIAVP
jgi:predicted transcriptional regulator YdeE